MQVTAISWTGLVVEDYPGALKFFSEVTRLSLVHEYKKSQIAHFRLTSGQLLEIYGPGNRQRRPEKFQLFDGHALGFEVDDLELYYQKLVERGVRFIGEIETWQDEAWAMFLGPEKQLLQIQSAGSRPAVSDSPIISLSWAGLTAQDFAAAVDFFADVMELPLEQGVIPEESVRFALPGGQVFEIVNPFHPWYTFLERMNLGFQVEDIEKARTELAAAGVEFVTEIDTAVDGNAVAFFKGPERQLYALLAASS